MDLLNLRVKICTEEKKIIRFLRRSYMSSEFSLGNLFICVDIGLVSIVLAALSHILCWTFLAHFLLHMQEIHWAAMKCRCAKICWFHQLIRIWPKFWMSYFLIGNFYSFFAKNCYHKWLSDFFFLYLWRISYCFSPLFCSWVELYNNFLILNQPCIVGIKTTWSWYNMFYKHWWIYFKVLVKISGCICELYFCEVFLS